MPLPSTYTLPAAADMHVHLRNAPGPIASLVTPTIRRGGVDTVFVMPNLAPRPVVSLAEAQAYREALQKLDPEVNYLMSLYLHESVTPEVIRGAKEGGIWGVKAYPRGATTNSQWGVVSFDPFHEVLKAMEEEGIVLNLHGEVPSSAADGVTVMNAEMRFLPVLKELSGKYPELKIVLEHCTSADAVEAVRALGDNVVGTITAHHLSLLVDDCTTTANLRQVPEDRRALLNAVVTSNGKFFLGTDSARVFTQPYALGYVLSALEEGIARGDIQESAVTEDVLKGSSPSTAAVSTVCPRDAPDPAHAGSAKVEDSLNGDDGVVIVPFRAGEEIWG
ncbi:dihydroorotase [Collariella sp. IMI 366227]|nr:dihydroorotase [Collariella sp. IMI 366227]